MLLSLDASLSYFSWCLQHQNQILAQDHLRLAHYESLPLYLKAELEKLNLSPLHIDRLAIIHGPGNYTGLRASLALVRTWHMLYGTPVVCKNRLETLLHVISLDTDKEIMVSQSVRMNEFFILKGKRNANQPVQITQPLLKISATVWSEQAEGLSVYGDAPEGELPASDIQDHWQHLAPVLATWAAQENPVDSLIDISPLYTRQAVQKK